VVKKISIAIVGAGKIANEHLRVLSSFEQVAISGITSRTHKKAEELADKYNIKYVLDNIDDLVNVVKPDALLINVSVNNMFEVIEQALNYKLPLFIEKPAGLLPEETIKLADKAQNLNVLTMVGYNRRYYSNFHEGIRLIQEHGPLMGILVEGHERINLVRKSNKHPDNVIENWIYANSTHTIDLMRFFGGEISQIHSIAQRYKEPKCDQIASIMQFESGVMGEYIAHWLSPGGWRVALFANEAMVEFKPFEQGIYMNSNGEKKELGLNSNDKEYKPGFYGQMQAFIEMIDEEKIKWPAQNLQETVLTMSLAKSMVSEVTDRTGCLN